MSTSGGEAKALTGTAYQSYSPSFSPDGKSVVFMSARTEGFQLYRIDRDGSNETLLVTAAGSSSDPRWAN
jgi:TolB protein